ncbi:hypothetical protein DEO72_LG2g3719 [Vigna unguiculata]|uniref:Uncharacterized protein n=1 Tax=Vigna unguiculata TaxID=3917 RepID=A0A4D6L4I9_VIGUN|nr:hypothetical protein DEO72_LG2g3719 [Vigna unguiculata]
MPNHYWLLGIAWRHVLNRQAVHQDLGTPVRVAWWFLIAARRFITESHETIKNGYVTWRSILSRQAVSGQKPRIYENSREMEGNSTFRPWNHSKIIKTRLNKH